MLRSPWLKTLHDQWRSILGMGVGAGLLGALYVAFYPSIGAMDQLQEFIDQLPPALMALFAAEGLDLGTPEGFLNMELFSFVGPLFAMIYGASAAAAATAGEEERGTIDLLLANPIPRWRVVVEKAWAMTIGLFAISAALLLGVEAAAAAAGVEMDLWRVSAGIASNGLLGLALGGVALLLGALTGRRMVALGGTLAIAVASFFVNGLAPLVDWLEGLRPFSVFYHYIGYDPLNHGLDPFHAGVLLAIALVGTLAAALAFEHRDLVA
jgi:ABC-2 type transport system permease protein